MFGKLFEMKKLLEEKLLSNPPILKIRLNGSKWTILLQLLWHLIDVPRKLQLWSASLLLTL